MPSGESDKQLRSLRKFEGFFFKSIQIFTPELFFTTATSNKELKNQAKQDHCKATNDIVPKKTNVPMDPKKSISIEKMNDQNQGL